MILVYPVITMKEDFTHMGSRTNLLGENPDSRLVHNLLNETQVTLKKPSTFLIHASNDPAIPVMNSIQFFRHCIKCACWQKYMFMQMVRMGFGLAEQYLLLSSWPNLCKKWFEHW